MNTVEIFENKRASKYNKFVQTWIPNYDYFIAQLPKLLGHIENKNLLVAGCGTGNEIESFVKASELWNITGVDPSPEMINQARTKLNRFENVNLIEGVVSQLDINQKFNAATLLLVLHFMKDDGAKLSLLKDIAERLESHALFILFDITGNQTQLKQNLQLLKQLLPAHIAQEEIENRLYRIEHKLHAISEERLKHLLVEAGFEEPVRFFQTSVYMGWITKKK